MPTMPLVSVVLTTHNSPRALELVLEGYRRQDFTEFEVVLGDDGSREETREVVRRMRALCRFPLVHVWHPHRGHWGKMGIVNRAVLAARAEYLIIGDADVIPRHDYVRTHWEMKRPRCFLAGGDFRLVEEATRRVTVEDVRSGRVFDPAFLAGIGQPRTKKFIKLRPRGVVSRVIDAVNVSPARFSGSNASMWKADFVRVGGYDETFVSSGKDDTEFGVRLWNAGVKSRHVRHNAIVLHLWHGEGRPVAQANADLLEDTRRTRRVMARQGLELVRDGDHTVERQSPPVASE